MTFAEVQQGDTLIANGSHFVAASQVVINTTPLSATVVLRQPIPSRPSKQDAEADSAIAVAGR
jgi:hypothetical protein